MIIFISAIRIKFKTETKLIVVIVCIIKKEEAEGAMGTKNFFSDEESQSCYKLSPMVFQ